MATVFSGASNGALVDHLCRSKLITSAPVESAFRGVNRAQYCEQSPYDDRPHIIVQLLGISPPSTHARAAGLLLPYLLPSGGEKRRVLDVGSGSGFLVRLFAELTGESGLVVGVENDERLVREGEANVRKSEEGAALLDSQRVRFRLGDGRQGWVEGEEKEAGWDAIHVGAAVPRLPEQLVAQLRSPGRMVVPIDEKDEEKEGCLKTFLWTVEKDAAGNVTKTKLEQTMCPALTDGPGVVPLTYRV